jgi:hypothetical protein
VRLVQDVLKSNLGRVTDHSNKFVVVILPLQTYTGGTR